MMTEQPTQLLTIILGKLTPADISLKENRQLIAERIEKLLHQNNWTRRHFKVLMRKEVRQLRAWMGETYTLTIDSMGELCQLLHLNLGDLVAE